MTKDNTQALGFLYFHDGSRLVICQHGSIVTYAFLNSDPRIFAVDCVSESRDMFQSLNIGEVGKVYFH